MEKKKQIDFWTFYFFILIDFFHHSRPLFSCTLIIFIFIICCVCLPIDTILSWALLSICLYLDKKKGLRGIYFLVLICMFTIYRTNTFFLYEWLNLFHKTTICLVFLNLILEGWFRTQKLPNIIVITAFFWIKMSQSPSSLVFLFLTSN